MKRSALVSVLLLCLLFSLSAPVRAAPAEAVPVAAPSAVLMERSTGQILYEKDAYAHLAPASVTKVMTMLLVAEAVDGGLASLEETVTASAQAAGMGGSQIWLKEGEQMTLGEMLKCVAVVSANDCCVALAEHLAGSEEAFVARMNERAAELGMEDTHFVCCSGLSDSEDHYSCARDIAVMSRELLRHDLIRQYTGIWMDTIRDGAFTLSNTNKLIYYYPGATGLKTGFTSRAMYCLSASAEREGVEYIAVVLHAASSADRFDSAKALLSYGFANYTLLSPQGQAAIPPVAVRLGDRDSLQPALDADAGVLVERSKAAGLRWEATLPSTVTAPVEAGEVLGTLTAYSGGEKLCALPLTAPETVERLGLWELYRGLLKSLVN